VNLLLLQDFLDFGLPFAFFLELFDKDRYLISESISLKMCFIVYIRVGIIKNYLIQMKNNEKS